MWIYTNIHQRRMPISPTKHQQSCPESFTQIVSKLFTLWFMWPEPGKPPAVDKRPLTTPRSNGRITELHMTAQLKAPYSWRVCRSWQSLLGGSETSSRTKKKKPSCPDSNHDLDYWESTPGCCTRCCSFTKKAQKLYKESLTSPSCIIDSYVHMFSIYLLVDDVLLWIDALWCFTVCVLFAVKEEADVTLMTPV